MNNANEFLKEIEDWKPEKKDTKLLSMNEYLSMVLDPANKTLSDLAHARMYHMIESHGIEWYEDEDGETRPKYNFFDSEIFGLKNTIEKLVNLFHSGGRLLPVRKRIVMLMGPVGGGKSTIVSMLKKGLEQYTASEKGKVFAIEGCPLHEDPLHALPEAFRIKIREQNNIYIEGKLCPSCQYKLDNDFNGDFKKFKIERILFSEQSRTGIGTFSPSDVKSQDVAELIGSINLSKIADIGKESDPRAFTFDGELNIANRGMVELIEMLKCLSPTTKIYSNKHRLLSLNNLIDEYITDDFKYIPGNNVNISLKIKDNIYADKLIYSGKQQKIIITTKRGYKLECSDGHNLMSLQNGVPCFKEINDIAVNDWVVMNRNATHSNQEVNIPEIKISNNMKNIIKIKTINQDFAAILGYFIAEGSISGMTVNFSIFENELSEILSNHMNNIGLDINITSDKNNRIDHKSHSKHLKEILNSLGCCEIAKNKKVPNEIFISPDYVKAAFIRSYFDGDGTAANHRISCTSRSQQLISDREIFKR